MERCSGILTLSRETKGKLKRVHTFTQAYREPWGYKSLYCTGRRWHKMHPTLLFHYTRVRVNRNHRSNFLVWEFGIRKRQSWAAKEECLCSRPSSENWRWNKVIEGGRKAQPRCWLGKSRQWLKKIKSRVPPSQMKRKELRKRLTFFLWGKNGNIWLKRKMT